ncbi:Glucosylceramidase [Trichostrongylus colubriformis]|uniref:Glucosylceramidase n=1 Tax=Trichostrongylus colubriformis TaxID=6319 RepID=A0AAN8IVY7_TRICO
MLLNRAIILLNFVAISLAERPCAQRIYQSSDKNIVCVCNSTYCDDIEPIRDIPYGNAVFYTSSLSGKRFERSSTLISEGFSSSDVTITIDGRKTYQSIIGFGGAFTDAAGINLRSLSEETQRNLLETYFGENGIEYSIARVPIASTDFSTREYSYAESAGDFNMDKFKLAEEDYKYKIPYILSARNLTEHNLLLYASPWSAPAWMKENGHMKGGGALMGDVNGKYYQSYATYLVKFFEEYAKHGIPFWGMTLQNEPSSGALPFYKWQTMFFSAPMQRDFVKVTLGPMLKRNNVTKELKVMTLDDNRFALPSWADIIFNDNEAAKYVDGVAVHWYLDGLIPASVLTTTHNRHPDKFILATEACAGVFFGHGPILGDWYRAEEYAVNIIEDLNHFAAGWTDWNMCLNEQGGPNWVANFVDSPIIVNATSDEFYKQPMFYAMGHFSKFFKRDAVRVNTAVTGSKGVLATAFTYKGRRIVALVNTVSSSIGIAVNDATTSHHLHLIVEPHSVVTVLWDKQ